MKSWTFIRLSTFASILTISEVPTLKWSTVDPTLINEQAIYIKDTTRPTPTVLSPIRAQEKFNESCLFFTFIRRIIKLLLTQTLFMINYYELVVNNPEYFKQFCCRDLLFLNYDCPVKVRKTSKWSEHNYIYYVLSGKKTLHTMDQSLTLTQGSIAFIKKGACIIEQHFEEPFCIVVFIMPDSFIHSFLRDYLPPEKGKPDTTSPIFPIYDNEMIREFYQSILPYFVSPVKVPEEILELKFKELLLHLMHNPANEDLRNHLHYIYENPDTPIRHIMETNFAYNLRIEAYAKMTNRSVSSFKRDFQSLFNTTPGRWLSEKKLEKARKLLLQTDNTIADVAFESGFENTAHFSRLFKQKTGTTPMEYRKKAGVTLLQAV